MIQSFELISVRTDLNYSMANQEVEQSIQVNQQVLTFSSKKSDGTLNERFSQVSLSKHQNDLLLNTVGQMFLHQKLNKSDNPSWTLKIVDNSGQTHQYLGDFNSFYKTDASLYLERLLKDIIKLEQLFLFGHLNSKDRIQKFDFSYIEYHQGQKGKSTHINLDYDSGAVRIETHTHSQQPITFQVISHFVMELLQDYMRLNFSKPLEDDAIVRSTESISTYQLKIDYHRQKSFECTGFYDEMGMITGLKSALIMLSNSLGAYSSNMFKLSDFTQNQYRYKTDIQLYQVEQQRGGQVFTVYSELEGVEIGDFVELAHHEDIISVKVVAIAYYSKHELQNPIHTYPKVLAKVSDDKLHLAQLQYEMGSIKFKFLDVSMDNMALFTSEAWLLYQDPKTSFYPVIDNYEELQRIYKTAHMTNHLLVLEMDEKRAYLPLLVDDEQHYIQANGGLATAHDFDKFAMIFDLHLSKHFPGYTYQVGYPSSNQGALMYHQQDPSYKLSESLLRYDVSLNDIFVGLFSGQYTQLQPHHHQAFVKMHNQMEPDAYWDGESILEHDDRWLIVTQREDELSGYVAAIIYEKQGLKYAEIYFVHGEEASYTGMIEHLLMELVELEVDSVLCLAEKNRPALHEALSQNQFKLKNDYLSFVKTL